MSSNVPSTGLKIVTNIVAFLLQLNFATKLTTLATKEWPKWHNFALSVFVGAGIQSSNIYSGYLSSLWREILILSRSSTFDTLSGSSSSCLHKNKNKNLYLLQLDHDHKHSQISLCNMLDTERLCWMKKYYSMYMSLQVSTNTTGKKKNHLSKLHVLEVFTILTLLHVTKKGKE